MTDCGRHGRVGNIICRRYVTSTDKFVSVVICPKFWFSKMIPKVDFFTFLGTILGILENQNFGHMATETNLSVDATHLRHIIFPTRP